MLSLLLQLSVATSDTVPLLEQESTRNSTVIHRAFVKSPSDFENAWKAGEEDAAKNRKWETRVDRFRRGIGQRQITVLASETVSWCWLIPIEYIPYYNGWHARKQYWTDFEITEAKATLFPTRQIVVDELLVFGIINLLPSIGSMSGQISRHPDPRNLEDVRVIIKVGDRILRPREQPGNLLTGEKTAVNTFSIPRYTYSRTDVSGVSTSGGRTSTMSGTATTSGYVNEYYEEGYKWYQGNFSVSFDLVNEKGEPLITADDDSFEVVVVYGNNERTAKYNLRDLEKPLG